MPVVTFDYNDFIDILGYQIPKEQLLEKMPMIGADLDRVEDDEISIEFFPDRPDLTSVEGIARAARTFFGFTQGITHYPIKKSDIVVTVDKSVKTVRPYVTTALVTNVTMSDALIASLMDLQEKLHFGLGRNRKKVAIGVHNFEPVQPPFVYKAVDPESVSFIPLAKDDYMTLSEILTHHEKGVDYAHILKDFDKYPLIVDKNNNVLSFPPIINGSLTEVTPFTTDLFIDVTGTDRKYINYALNIVTSSLAERGGEIHTTTVEDGDESFIVPDFTPVQQKLSVEYVQKILGLTLKEQDIIDSLGKMGYNAKKIDASTFEVEIPQWRSDILHEIDVIEDVAIGYGFDNFEVDFPKKVTFGQTLPDHDFRMALRKILIGLGFNEVTTFTISNERDEFTNLGLKPKQRVEMENPIGEDYSCLRVGLLTSLLKILHENRHHSLPQSIFELGLVVDEHHKNQWNIAAMKIDAKANFTACKSLVEALLRDIGATYHISEYDHPAFIKGRCGAVHVDNLHIGFFGELHPKTITTYELDHPIIYFELTTDKLKI